MLASVREESLHHTFSSNVPSSSSSSTAVVAAGPDDEPLHNTPDEKFACHGGACTRVDRASLIMLALCLVSQPALLLPTVPRAQPLPTCTRRAPPPVLGLFDEFPLSRRETLLLLPLTLVGIGGIRYATTDAFPTSIEGPITKAPTVDMRGKVAVVTGANTGIGYETALRLAQEGATVVLAGRSLAKLTDAAERIRAQLPFSTVEVEVLDLASLESVRKFAAAFLARHGTLDALINNAGVSAIPERRETADGIEQILQVNFLGHFLLTSLLMPALRAAAAPRVINVSSRASFLPNAKLTQGETPQLDLQHAGAAYGACQTPVDCPAYSASKMAQLIFTRELQRRLGGESSRALVLSVHPGLVATELLRYSTVAGPAGTLAAPAAEVAAARRALNFWGAKTPEQGAQTTLFAVTSPTLTPRTAGGHFLRECADAEKEAVSSSELEGLGYRDERLAAALWREAERLTGAEFSVTPLV